MAKKASNKANKIDREQDLLANELKGLIPQLDSEGLAFLVQQARVHLYNMQVDKLNKAAGAVNEATAREAALKRERKQAKTEKENLRIIGSDSGSSYYIYYRNSNIMFSQSEMLHLVKIASAKGTDLEIRERLYNWFDRERRDIFALIPLADKFDDRLKTIAALLKKNFKIRNE